MATVLLLRQPILDFVVNKAKEKFKEKFDVELKIRDAGFAGIRDIYFTDVSLVPANGDTLLKVNNVYARINLTKLLRLKVGFRELVIDTSHLSLVRRENSDNFSFFKRRDKEASVDTLKETNTSDYSDRLMGVLEKINDVFSERITFRQFKVSYQRGLMNEYVNIPELFFDGSVFQSSVITASKEGVNLWIVNGTADASNSSYDFHVKRTRGERFALPFLDLVDGFKVCFDSANVKVNAVELDGKVDLKGVFNMHQLLVSHWRISPKDVHFPKMEFVMNAFVDKDSLGLAPGTLFTLNELPISISTSYAREPIRKFAIKSAFETKDAQQVFDAMPNGMFYTFDGFKAKGGLTYELYCEIPLDKPSDIVFNSSLKKDKFQIVSYGTENFSKIVSPFSFLAMDGDRALRSFSVGPENPYFTPINYISPYLINAVLTAEDPSFMNHGGFVMESFRESIATNLREKRFARGGSTISMQLVKNVFLSRNKSVSRKLEEVLIVWLIENQRLISKERMLEVYLNIIEWGPDVYGIGEASRFYFEKSPDELTLSESIFLASLIPSPKLYRYRFDPQGNLKPYVASFMKLVSNRLVIREKIAQVEADSLKLNIQLTGPAMNIFVAPDSTVLDSIPKLPIIN
jgi:Transglycosylase